MIKTLGRKSTPQRVKRRALSIPAEFGGDPIICAAWLPFEESMTGEEVAHPLSMSRASVVNLLQETRDRNIVTIVVSSPHLQTVNAALSGDTATVLVTNEAMARAHIARRPVSKRWSFAPPLNQKMRTGRRAWLKKVSEKRSTVSQHLPSVTITPSAFCSALVTP